MKMRDFGRREATVALFRYAAMLPGSMNRIEFRRKLKPKYVRVDLSVMRQDPKYSSSHPGYEAMSAATAEHGHWPTAAGNHGQASVHMEIDYEGPYRCSRIGHGHPRCQPDVRADGRQQRGELLRPGVWTELPLLSVRPLRARGSARRIAGNSRIRDNSYR